MFRSIFACLHAKTRPFCFCTLFVYQNHVAPRKYHTVCLFSAIFVYFMWRRCCSFSSSKVEACLLCLFYFNMFIFSYYLKLVLIILFYSTLFACVLWWLFTPVCFGGFLDTLCNARFIFLFCCCCLFIFRLRSV